MEKIQSEPPVILLVEDNPAHAELIMRGLENVRVANRVVHVSDGEKALDYLFRRGNYAGPETSTRPSLVLLDLRLPKIDGIEILHEIRRSDIFDGLPVVILTSSEVEQDMVNGYKHNINSYLVKPLDFTTFMQMLDDVSYYWLYWNKCPEIKHEGDV